MVLIYEFIACKICSLSCIAVNSESSEQVNVFLYMASMFARVKRIDEYIYDSNCRLFSKICIKCNDPHPSSAV